MDVAMNANASELNGAGGGRSCPRFTPRSAWAARRARCWAGWLGGWERSGASWGPLCSVVARRRRGSVPGGRGRGSGGAGFAAPSRRLLPLAALAFVRLRRKAPVGDWSGTYLARSGVSAGVAAAAYAAFSLLMITGRVVGDGIVAAAGPRATVGLGALIAGAGSRSAPLGRGLPAASSASDWLARASPTSCLCSSASRGGQVRRRRLASLRPRPQATRVC